MADLLVRDADLVATVDAVRREVRGGWVSITDGFVESVGGPSDPQPAAAVTFEQYPEACDQEFALQQRIMLAVERVMQRV